MEFTINTIGFVFIILGCLIAGAIAGFFIARHLISKQLKENPPFNKDQIRAMYRSMGVTPSEARVNRTMRDIEAAQKSNIKKR